MSNDNMSRPRRSGPDASRGCPRGGEEANGVVPGGDVDLGRFLTAQEVRERTTLSTSQIRVMQEEGTFPPYVRPWGRKHFMPERVLDGWFESIIELRDGMRTLLDSVRLPEWTLRLPSGDYPSGLRALRRPQVLARLRIQTSHLYRWVGPRREYWPVPLSERCRGWMVHELDEWRDAVAGTVYWQGGTSLGDAERRDRPEPLADDEPRDDADDDAMEEAGSSD